MLGDAPFRTFLALDPGVTTGWCKALLDGETLKLKVGQTAFTMAGMWDALCMNVWDDLIYEDFEYRNFSRAGLDLTPVKIIGVIELFLERNPGTQGWKQNAAKGKSYYSDDKLKQYGVYSRGLKHSRDAVRHLMHYLTFGAGSQYCDIDKLAITIKAVDTIDPLAEGTLP